MISVNATGFHGTRFFQVYGTQSPASYNQDYHNYAGNKWVTYRIPLWQHFQNTNNKSIEQLVFAADDDGTQVNQKVFYKNIELIENYTAYQLPTSFNHGPVIVEPTTNSDIFYHKYPQIITGPNNVDYPVSGGSIVKTVYSPPNTSIEEVVSVKEIYYENLCWDQGLNYSGTTLANDSMNYLQLLSNNSSSKLDAFRNQQPVVLTQENQMYFDPDVKINGQLKSRFINRATISSNQSSEYYFESKDAGQNSSVKSGFVYIGVDCNQPATGTNTKGECFDLNGLTEPINSSSTYVANSPLTSVYKHKENEPISMSLNLELVSDSDNRWSDNVNSRQTTELLTNTKFFNSYLQSAFGSNFQSETQFKPTSVISSGYSGGAAAYSPSTKKVYFSSPGTQINNKNMTYSRDMGVVAHENAHALSHKWFNGQLHEGVVEGCAISEGFSDIMGYGTKVFTTGLYNPGVAVDAFDNNDGPNGIRSAQFPSLTENDSYFHGNGAQGITCATGISGDICNEPGPLCDDTIIHITGHKMATIISHLYHLMVYGGFNENASFEPDPFGVSPDETFTHIAAEKLFFDAMKLGHGSANAVGSDVTFCELRNNMIGLRVNDSEKVRINQAWKQVYQNLDSDSTDDGDGKKCQLPDNVRLLQPEISITNTHNNINILDGSSINFGNLDNVNIKTHTLMIKNEGDYVLRLINPSIVNSAFIQTGISSNQQLTIDVGSSATIDVSFSANNSVTGQNDGRLTFNTNHPDHETYTIYLSGVYNISQGGNADAYENDDTIQQAKYLATNINYSFILYPPSPYPPGYDCNTVPWVGDNPPTCDNTFPVPIPDRNFADDSIDWVIAKLEYRGEMGPFAPFVLQISNFQSFPIDICYESEDPSALVSACVNILAYTTHLISFSTEIWTPPGGLEYKIKLTNPTPAINFEYLAVMR